MSRIVLTPPVAGEPTLGDLERQGRLPKELIGHLNRVYGLGGWRQLTSRQEDALSDKRLAELRADVAESEATILECALRIRELELRREELAAERSAVETPGRKSGATAWLRRSR